MQDFARFCNAKMIFPTGAGVNPLPNSELKSRVVQLIKQGSDKAMRCDWSLQFHCNTTIDKSQLGASMFEKSSFMRGKKQSISPFQDQPPKQQKT